MHIKPLFEFHFTEMKDGGSSFVHGQLFFWWESKNSESFLFGEGNENYVIQANGNETK